MCLSQLPPKFQIVDDRSYEVSVLGWIPKFALRFTATYGPMGERKPRNWISIVLPSGGAASATFESTDTEITPKMQQHQNSVIPVDEARLTYNDDGTMTLIGSIAMGEVEVILQRQDKPESLLMSRGFRWINETPFNR